MRRVLLYSALWVVLAVAGVVAIARPWSRSFESGSPERRDGQLAHLPQRRTDVILHAAPWSVGVAVLVIVTPPILFASLWLWPRKAR